MNLNEILDIYKKAGISVEPLQDDSLDWGYSTFGIYTENGFDFSTTTLGGL